MSAGFIMGLLKASLCSKPCLCHPLQGYCQEWYQNCKQIPQRWGELCSCETKEEHLSDLWLQSNQGVKKPSLLEEYGSLQYEIIGGMMSLVVWCNWCCFDVNGRKVKVFLFSGIWRNRGKKASPRLHHTSLEQSINLVRILSTYSDACHTTFRWDDSTEMSFHMPL